MSKSPAEIALRSFLSLSLLLMGALNSVATWADNTPTVPTKPDLCPTTSALSSCPTCEASNAPGMPANEETTCPGGSCSEGTGHVPGVLEAETDSIHIAIVCGRAPHESVQIGKLVLYAEQPSADLFSPASLSYSHVLGGAITRVKTEDGEWDATVERQVTVMDLSGMPNTFQFLANESVGLPLDPQYCASLDYRLRKIDANGNATTGEPACYDFFMQGERKFIRYSATSRDAVGYDNGNGRYIQDAATGVEVLKDTEGVIRQVKTATELVDIVIPAADGTTALGTIWKYTVSFYPDSDVGAKADGIYTLQQGATAHTVITFQNPAQDKDNDFNALTLTRSVGGTDYVYEYTYTDASKQWRLGRGAGLPYETLASQFDDTGKIETKTREVREADGTLVSSTIETWVEFDWGTQKVAESVRTDANDPTALLTTGYLYYDPGTMAANDPRRDYIVATASTAKHGRVHSVRYPTGAWTVRDYDSEGRPTVVVRPWKDQTLTWTGVSETTITTAAANGDATYYSYTAVDADDSPASDDRLPRTTAREITGTAVSKTFNAYYENTSGERVEITEQASDPTASYGETGNLRTTMTYFAPNAAAASAGRLKTVRRPGDLLDTYTYEKGTYTSNATPSLCSFTPGTGGAFRTTVTHGTASSPAGVANRTTRETRVRDAYGNQVLEEIHVYDGTDYERIGWKVRTYDDRWRPEYVYSSDGTSTSTAWGCCGKDSETRADGTEWSYGYDSLSRLTSRTKECGATDIVTSYTYDAAGRQLTQTVTAAGLSLSTSLGYDLAGRVTRQISKEGLLTTTAYTDGGLTVRTTHPGGGTEAQASYLDGRAKSSTGTYVTNTYHDYGVDTTTVTGQVLHTVTTYQGVLPQGGTFTDIPLWTRVYTNPLRQTVRREMPAFGYTVANPALAVSTWLFDSSGRLARQTSPLRADTLHEYASPLGELIRSGLDLNGNGGLDLATDRVTESSTSYEEDANGDWWRVTDSKLYSTESDDPATAGVDERVQPVTVGVRRVRLTGLGATTMGLGLLVAEERSTDTDTDETVSRIYIDRSAKRVTHVLDSPFSSSDSSVVTVNGLPTRAVSASGQATHYLYNDVEYLTGVTDPRVSSYDAQTDTWSNYVETHYNSVGQMDWMKDTAGNQTSYGYDTPPTDPTDAQRQAATGRQVSATDALGKTKRMAYSVRGQLHRVWGDTEYPLEYGYDENGRPTTLKTYRGGTGWNGTDWPTATTGTADTTTWNYEPETGLLESKEYADGKGPSYTYYSDGSPWQRTWARTVDGSALVTTYIYDSDTGQLTDVDYSDSGTSDLSYTYTRTGKVKTVTDITGTRTFTYTAEGKLDTEALPPSFYGATTTLTRSYDTLGRKDGYALSYDSSGIQSPHYAYDTYGRFSSVEEGDDTFTYGYLASSDLVNTLSGQASTVQTRTYETTRNLIDYVENKVAGTTVSKYDYTNDTIGRRTGVQKSGTAFTTTDTVTWGYDSRSQVTSAVAATDATYDYTYAYDPMGNRTTYVTKETGTPVTTGYTANQLNQYTAITSRTNPAYDDDGNMTLMPDASGDWTLTWNGENRLASAESSSARLEFLYDYMGRRVEKKTYTGTTGNWALSETRRFLYHGRNLIAEITVDGATAGLDRTHVWGLDLVGSLQAAGGVGGLLRTSEHRASATAYFPAYDANGSVSEYLDSTGSVVAHYEYSPFGRSTAATGTKAAAFQFRYSTKYSDAATDLYDYGYRCYSVSFGRWLTRDPLYEKGGENLLAFCRNNAVDSFDYLGMWRVCCDWVRGDNIEGVCEKSVARTFIHCEYVPGTTCTTNDGKRDWTVYFMGYDRDPTRTMDDGTPCSTATDKQIEDCAKRHMNNAGTGTIDDNCQSAVVEFVQSCCMKTNWRPDWIANPFGKCLEYKYVTKWQHTAAGPIAIPIKVCVKYEFPGKWPYFPYNPLPPQIVPE